MDEVRACRKVYGLYWYYIRGYIGVIYGCLLTTLRTFRLPGSAKGSYPNYLASRWHFKCPLQKQPLTNAEMQSDF